MKKVHYMASPFRCFNLISAFSVNGVCTDCLFVTFEFHIIHVVCLLDPLSCMTRVSSQ